MPFLVSTAGLSQSGLNWQSNNICGSVFAMATGEKSARFATKMWLALLVLLALGFYPISLVLWHWTPRDRNGDRPRDVARAFIEAVQSNDFAGATRFWEPGATRRVEANFQTNFEDFCTETFKFDIYKLGITTRQKEGLRMVPFAGKHAGGVKAYSLYFRKVDGVWKIGEDLWIPDASAPWQNPATSNWPPNL